MYMILGTIVFLVSVITAIYLYNIGAGWVLVMAIICSVICVFIADRYVKNEWKKIK